MLVISITIMFIAAAVTDTGKSNELLHDGGVVPRIPTLAFMSSLFSQQWDHHGDVNHSRHSCQFSSVAQQHILFLMSRQGKEISQCVRGG